MTELTRRRALQGLAGSVGAASLAGRVAGEGGGRYLVGLRSSGATEVARQEAVAVRREFDWGGDRKTVCGEYSQSAVEELRSRPDVRYVEPDGRVRATGQRLTWGIDRVDAPAVHDNGETGAGTDVAVLDTGIDGDHPDLAANVGSGVAFVDCSGSCDHDWSDDNDHGTHCAGIAGAADNAEGVVGVAPEATLHAVKVLASDGRGYWSDVAAGLEHVADQGWDVASLSLSGDAPSQTLHDACKYAHEKGVLVVAAAGNAGPCSDCVGYPAAYPEVVAVSSTNSSDGLSDFSSTGPEVELAAPGSGVYSTVPGGYATFSGTSMATPHVAGAGALLVAGGATNVEARETLASTAEDVGLGENESGNGLLDPEAAVLGSDAAPSVSLLAPDGGRVAGTVPVRIAASDAEDATDTLTVEYRVDGGSWRAATYDADAGEFRAGWDSTAVGEGDHTLTARATDSAGNVRRASVAVTVDNVDQSPTVSWVAPGDGTRVVGSVPVRIAASDPEDATDALTVEYRVDGGSWRATSYDADAGEFRAEWDSAAVDEGDHTLTARATDSAGNAGVADVSVAVDHNAAPTCSVVAPSDGETVTGSVVVRVDVEDDDPVDVEVGIDGTGYRAASSDGDGGPYSVEWDTTRVGNGEHAVTARATDADGAVTEASPVPVTVDNPTLTVATGEATDVGPGSAKLVGSVESLGQADMAGVRFEYGEAGGSLAETTETQWVTSARRVGAEVTGLSTDTTYAFRAVAGTGDGNPAVGEVVEFTTGESNAAPTVEVVETPDGVESGAEFELAAAGEDPDGDDLTYSWIQSAGPDASSVVGQGPDAAFTAPDVDEPTDLTFEVTVDDGAATASAATTVTVEPAEPADPVDRADGNDDGEIDSSELGGAISSWARGEFDTGDLTAIIRAWAAS